MRKMKWGRKLAASILSLVILCIAMPEAFYAAAVPEESVEQESAKPEKSAKWENTGTVESAIQEKNGEAIDSTGRLDWDDISVADAVEIQEDQIQNVNIAQAEDYQVFKFIPEETKTYTFFSAGTHVTLGMIKDEDGFYVGRSDDGFVDEKADNFSITVELTAGKVYYCAARMLGITETGTFLCMISSTRFDFTLENENIKKFEITDYDNTRFYEYQNNIDDLPDVEYHYRITCMDGQVIEGYNQYSWNLFGAVVSVRFENEIEEGIADTSSGSNALIYSLDGVEAEGIPITFVPSPVASMEVLANPWTTILPISEYDLINDMTGLRIRINYTNGNSATAVGDGEEWYIEEEDDWVYPKYRWKNYDEYGDLEVGLNAIVFTYMGVEVEVPVTIADTDLQSISILKNPEKLVYDAYENTVDLFGLNLQIAYTDGTSEVVTVTKHGGDIRIGKYSLRLDGYFECDDDYRKTGLICLDCKDIMAFYRVTIHTYAALIKNAADILPGQAASVSLNANTKCRVFRFVPLDTKEYVISSTGVSDTYVELLDAGGNILDSDDDGAGAGNNFKLASNLQAGKTYYYVARMYDVGETGAFTVTLSGASVYTITYHLNGGANHASNPAAYYSQAVNLQNPTRANYLFAGWYTDSACRNKITQISGNARRNYALYAKWEKVKTPGKVKITSAVNNKAKKISVKYKKAKNVAGYEVAYATNKKFKKASSVATGKTKATVGKLKKGKTYYVRVCAYNLDSTGQKIRGKWSSAKRVTVKK